MNRKANGLEELEIFDFNVISRNFADMDGEINAEAFVRCEEMFGKVIEQRIIALKQAIDERRVKDVELLAHQLKGSFLVLGSQSLANTCLKLELEAETLAGEELTSLLDSLKETLPKFRERLTGAVEQVRAR